MDSLTRVLNSSSLVRRTVAVAVLAAAIASVIVVVLAATVSVKSRADAMYEKRQHLGRLQAVLALKSMLEDQSVDTNEEHPEFLSGASNAVIQAELQAWLSLIAADHKVEIMSVGNAPLLEQNGMRFAGLRANIAGTNQGIQGMIFEIEAAKPYLIIRQAQLHSTVSSQEVRRKGPEELVLQVQFYGALPPLEQARIDTTGAIR